MMTEAREILRVELAATSRATEEPPQRARRRGDVSACGWRFWRAGLAAARRRQACRERHDVEALAGHLVQARRVADGEDAAAIVDDALVAQRRRGQADRRSRRADHLREELVGQLEARGLGALGGEQEPARQALHRRV